MCSNRNTATDQVNVTYSWVKMFRGIKPRYIHQEYFLIEPIPYKCFLGKNNYYYQVFILYLSIFLLRFTTTGKVSRDEQDDIYKVGCPPIAAFRS